MVSYDNTSTSSMAEAMGAKITLTGPGNNLYLVIGKSVSPESLVISNGGEIALKISTLACLATLTFENYTALKTHRDISRIGPVSINMERFNQVIEMLKNNPS